jgi:DNA invertase Pin-like site-specific DNA recombinase
VAAGGQAAVDLNEPDYRALMMMLGHQSEREVLRSRFRTTAAIRAQAREQGRHLGGRPRMGTGWWTRAPLSVKGDATGPSVRRSTFGASAHEEGYAP